MIAWPQELRFLLLYQPELCRDQLPIRLANGGLESKVADSSLHSLSALSLSSVRVWEVRLCRAPTFVHHLNQLLQFAICQLKLLCSQSVPRQILFQGMMCQSIGTTMLDFSWEGRFALAFRRLGSFTRSAKFFGEDLLSQ